MLHWAVTANKFDQVIEYINLQEKGRNNRKKRLFWLYSYGEIFEMKIAGEPVIMKKTE